MDAKNSEVARLGATSHETKHVAAFHLFQKLNVHLAGMLKDRINIAARL